MHNESTFGYHSKEKRRISRTGTEILRFTQDDKGELRMTSMGEV